MSFAPLLTGGRLAYHGIIATPRHAYVVGSGPNGLTAAIVLARSGLAVTVLEAQSTLGGGTRSAALTLPGFVHDVCSAVHPLALSSPVFASFPLAEYGLEWIQPPSPLAHPFDDGSAILVKRSIGETCGQLGRDAATYRRLMEPLARRWKRLSIDILGPLGFPRSPLVMARFGLLAPWPAITAARTLFREPSTRALFAGMSAHSILPLERAGTAAFGLVLSLAAHAVGWPIPRGGSQSVAHALASYLQSLGGRIVTNSPVSSLNDLRDGGLVLCDVTPRQLLAMGGSLLPSSYRRKLQRFRYGPGAYKLDWALSGPIPWTARPCSQAATVHVGGSMEEIAASERAPWEGGLPRRPFVLVVQPSLFDFTRAPSGRHTAWAYCHVPNGSTAAMTERIENQIERFAPGFRSRILARSVMAPADLESYNANLVGGDINGGALDLGQLVVRPTLSQYRTPVKGLYICSASTPPGGGVHGMCGYYAVRAALRDFGAE